jgi:hypothetical protein
MSEQSRNDRADVDRLIANVVRASSKVQWCRARWESDEQARLEEEAAVAALRAAFETDAAAKVPLPASSWSSAVPAGPHAPTGELELRCEGTQLLEVVGTGRIHLEQMSHNHWWVVLEAGGRRVDVWLHAGGRITATFETQENVASDAPAKNEPEASRSA